VVVVTGCENVEPTMDRWWIDNEPSFTQAGMLFRTYSTVMPVSAPLKDQKQRVVAINEDLVEESVEVVRRLVVRCCMSIGWEKVPSHNFEGYRIR